MTPSAVRNSYHIQLTNNSNRNALRFQITGKTTANSLHPKKPIDLFIETKHQLNLRVTEFLMAIKPTVEFISTQLYSIDLRHSLEFMRKRI
jgi:hypothetical protein